MRTSIKVTGFKETLAAMGAAQSKLDAIAQDTIEDAAFKTHSNAVRGIQRGPATGRVYKRGGITHQASALGQYPASDTGRLASSVQIEGIGKPIVSVGTALQYGRFLEFGTVNMAPRPWLTPSFEMALRDVIRDAKKRFNREFK